MMSETRRTRRAVGQLTIRIGGHALWVSVLMCCVLLAGISIGETFIPWQHVIHTLSNQFFDTRYAVDALDAGIIWNYRLTRALVSACCGACLAVSGVVLQSLLRNALAEPYLLGISAGASTGAVLIALTGLGAGIVSMSLGAFIGALTAFLFVALLAIAAGGDREAPPHKSSWPGSPVHSYLMPSPH